LTLLVWVIRKYLAERAKCPVVSLCSFAWHRRDRV